MKVHICSDLAHTGVYSLPTQSDPSGLSPMSPGLDMIMGDEGQENEN